jgi:hypothetical protein
VLLVRILKIDTNIQPWEKDKQVGK